MKRILFLLGVIFALITPANAQLLYKISGNGLEKPSYIFGTHHLAPLSILDSINGFQQAFNTVDQIVGEIDMSGNIMELAMKMQPYMIAPSDSTLDKILSPETYAATDIKLKHILGEDMPLSINMFKMLRPAAISNTISQIIMQRDFPEMNLNQQLDSYLQKIGKESGKSTMGLETAEMQAELLFCFTPITKQADELLELLDNADELKNQVKELNEAYFNQNLEELTEIALEEETDPAFFDALLRQRNNNWMKQIPTLISTQPTMIVVGALHLPADYGLLQQLRNLGYEITAIN
ncbi:MAG: TraB/GumN family protein [Muribaculaceae bacterium]|nr:TraB/GumN family protein [Muribaculaceae bacterium]